MIHLTYKEREWLEEFFTDPIIEFSWKRVREAIRRILDAPARRCGSCRWWATIRKHERCVGDTPDWYCANWEAK